MRLTLCPAAILFGMPRLWNACSIGLESAPYLTAQAERVAISTQTVARRARGHSRRIAKSLHSMPVQILSLLTSAAMKDASVSAVESRLQTTDEPAPWKATRPFA